MLMPQPYSGRHNGYLRNYQTTGVPKILDKTQEVGRWQQQQHQQQCT
jgi:hypothetical protein